MVPAGYDIRVLGPLEVVAGDGAVPVGRPRQRALLGLLALRARQIVSQDALVDGLWDERPPRSAVRTLHAHVAHLRRALDVAGLGVLVGTRAPGYVLTVAPRHLDVDRFTDLVQPERVELPHRTAQRLRAALDLWRGDVLSDCVVGDWARAEAASLRECRLDATERLLEAELAMGRYHTVVSEVESLLGRHPLRERLWELLMRALHAAGRRADALQTYRRAGAVLREELGVSPGAALRELEAAVLAGDRPRGAGFAGEQARGTGLAGDGAPGVVRAGGGARGDSPGEAGGQRPGEAGPGDGWGSDGGDRPGDGVGRCDGGPPIGVPVPVTSLVGRDSDIVELTGLLSERRLVTLTGVGGSGKTRLAVAVATAVAATQPVGFVDLSPIADPELLPAAVCTALGIRDTPAPDAIVRNLRARRLLLVLDNCEQLLASCATLFETLLRACPGLRVLATSCAELGVPGETAWPVQPLRVPDPGVATLSELRGFDAARLFLDRAALPAVRALDDSDVPALVAICAGLDGLPLALELAAARTAVLTVAEIAGRLRDPAVLRGDRDGGRPHHRALDAAVAWSYGILPPDARLRFRQLAVFVGGFTLAAAADVWGETESQALGDLSELVARSLVVVDRRAGRARYRLLETIRHHVATRLAAAPAQDRAARSRHAAHYLALAVETDRRLRGPDAPLWVDRLGDDHENLRAALAWYAAAGSQDELRLALALARYCRVRGRYAEGGRWLLEALARATGLPAARRAPAVLAAAFLAYFQGSYAEATRLARTALAGHREAGDVSATARCLRLLGSIACECGDYERARASYADALTAYRSVDDPQGEADILQMTGFAGWLAGDLDGAEPVLRQALRRYGGLDDAENVASVRVHLAVVAHYRGRAGAARWLAEEARGQFTELDFKEGIAWAENVLGMVALRAGRIPPALAALGRSLDLHWQMGDRWRQASVLEALAAAHLALGDAVLATELAGLATTLRDDLGVPVPAVEQPEVERTRAELAGRLGEQEWYLAFARGAALTVAETVADVRVVPGGRRSRGPGLTGEPGVK